MIVGTREIVSYGEEMEKTSRQHKTKIVEQNVLILLFWVLEIKYANINAQAFRYFSCSIWPVSELVNYFLFAACIKCLSF